MKDPHDKTTRDLIDKPRRGRPATGKAKSQAQIQREYRQRVKAKKLAMQQPLTHAVTHEVLNGPEFVFQLSVPEICRMQHALEVAYLIIGEGFSDRAAYQLYYKLNQRVYADSKTQPTPPH